MDFILLIQQNGINNRFQNLVIVFLPLWYIPETDVGALWVWYDQIEK